MLEQFGIVGTLLDLWWLWPIIAAIFGFLAWQNNRKAKNMLDTERVVLLLEIPKANEKKELAAEQMFASLHGILRSKRELIKEGHLQEHLSFEFASIGNQIRFYVSVPKQLQNFVEGQIYAQYPTVQIYTLSEDYANREITQPIVHTAEVALTDNEVLPIKTFPSFEVDPLAAITATLSKLEEQEEIWVQILTRPIDDSWHTRGSRIVARIKSGGSWLSGGGGLFASVGRYFSMLSTPPEPKTSSDGTIELSERDKGRITAIEEKTKKLGFQVKIRIVYLGLDKNVARLRMQAMVGTFKQFNTTNLNSFGQKKSSFDFDKIIEYSSRHFVDQGDILNIEELASVYHLPHTTVETPSIVWATAKTAEPPPSLPTPDNTEDQMLSLFGITNFRGSNIQFGAKRSDRGRHMYIVGQTGVGKSGMLELLTLSDVFHDQGLGVIDPHGDYAQSVLQYVPAHRIEDVVYFNPADSEFPIGFNPLEVTDPTLKNHISSELVGVLKRMFESWGPRLEYILRYTILALLDYPNSTMLDITRMLTEKDFRLKVIEHTQDPVVRNFWVNEFASWNDKFAAEAVAPVLNKVGAFTANPMIRNIVGQPKSTINLRHIMDNGKILIVNLSRGLVGEDNAAVLGALMVTKIQLAAMSRANIANLADRRPFYLYVDEFQNFATDSFAVILSEARKYGLSLTVANQYVAQINPVVRDAVFGNVGSIVSFRVGADDAQVLQKYFEPQFDAQDLIQMHNRNLVAAMSIDGEKTPAFSATTLNIPPVQADHSHQIIEHSRALYSRPRTEVEAQIKEIMPDVRGTGDQNANRSHRNKSSKKPKSSQQRSKSNKNASHQRSSSDKKSSNKSSKQPKTAKASDGHLSSDEVIKLR